MIINNLMGRLGNQMFQWACGRNLSIRDNVEMRLDTSWFNGREHDLKLGLFPNIKIVRVDGGENISEFISEPYNFDFVNFNEIKSPMVIYGYWQNKKYFEEILDSILVDFSMSNNKKLELIRKYPNILENSVSLHFRRGDYVNSSIYPTQSNEYYSKGLEIIGDYNETIVFSDDIEWCKQNLNFSKITFIENLSDIDSLWLMSLCTNNIIANSSFSWWGAFLNSNPNKKIIAPKNWFGEISGINSTSICPNDWIVI